MQPCSWHCNFCALWLMQSRRRLGSAMAGCAEGQRLVSACPGWQVADLRRLGARVVAADASSLILATGKCNLTAAVGCAPQGLRQ